MKILKKRFIEAGGIFLIIVFLELFSSNVMTQQKAGFLSLKEAVDAVTSNNSAVQSARIDEAIAQEKYKQINASFLLLWQKEAPANGKTGWPG